MSLLPQHTGGDVLRKAVDGHFTALAKVVYEGVPSEMHIQFLGLAELNGVEGCWARLVTSSAISFNNLISAATPVEIFFKTGAGIATCTSAVVKVRGWLWKPKSIFLRWPDNLSVVQRRNSQRERIPDDLEMHALIGVPAAHEARVPVSLFDLSTRGACLVCPRTDPLGSVAVGDAVNVLIRYCNAELPFSAHARRVEETSSNSVIIAVEFDAPEGVTDSGGTWTLDRLLADLTRLRLRRHFRSTLNYRTHKSA